MITDIMPSKKECDIKAIEEIAIEWLFKNRTEMRKLISLFLDQHRNDVLEEAAETAHSLYNIPSEIRALKSDTTEGETNA